MDPTPRKPGIAQYLRVSAADVQNPQNSFDYQRERIQSSLAQVANDLPVVAEYADILSGMNSKRPQYQKMLEDARRGKFSHLAVYSIDRLGRTTDETLRTVQELIDMGVEVVVADTPNLQMSTPSGNLLLGIRAVIAQYEVEMLSQRVKDTKRMMLLNGDWPAVQPDGYTRVREPGGKGRRPSRIVIDPERATMWREAWDLLLTGDYTLKKICQELHNRGYTRKSGKPWVWIDEETGNTRYADTAMQDSFRRPFYAGWVVSEAFGIVRGEVRGNWEPIVTDAEFDQGIKNMRHNSRGRVKEFRHYYMLSGILYYEGGERTMTRHYKMHGSTPKGRSRYYTYYVTTPAIDGVHKSVPTGGVDEQVVELLNGLNVDPGSLPRLRKLYEEHVQILRGPSASERIAELEERIEQMYQEEAALARLYAQGKLNDRNHQLLHREWQDKTAVLRQEIASLEAETAEILDGLDEAVLLLTRMPKLFHRLKLRQQNRLLRILFRRIIIDTQGTVVDFDLNPPFAYLSSLKGASPDSPPLGPEKGSKKVAGSNGLSQRLPIFIATQGTIATTASADRI